jgi:CBS domain containing-hemolysin-like protein
MSGTQLGITIASLGLGWVGELTLARIFIPLFEYAGWPYFRAVGHSVSLTVAFLLITFMHVVLGEVVPKNLALQRVEGVALSIARPMEIFIQIFRPFIAVLDRSADRTLRWMGASATEAHKLVHTPEELLLVVGDIQEGGLLDAKQEEMIRAVVGLGNVEVREVMVSRPDMRCLPATATMEEALEKFLHEKRSRLPVYDGTLDQIIGVLHARDLLRVLMERQRRQAEGRALPHFELRRVLRETLIVPETKPLADLLSEFQRRHTQIALVVDEFGNIQGLVTLADVMERITGKVHDEFDAEERPQRLSDGSILFDALMSVYELESEFGISVPRDRGFETAAGFVLSQLGRIPRQGDSFLYSGVRFTVAEMHGRRVAKIRIDRPGQQKPAKFSKA